jgi:predicted MFS family arabinose efflux permease
MQRSERTILLLLGAINFTHIMDFMIMTPLGNYLMPEFGIGPKEFSLLLASYPIAACVSSIIAAFFVDSFDRKKVLLFAYTGFIIGTTCCAFAPTYEFLLIARIVAGLFGGLIGAQVLSIVSDIIPYERRAGAMGIIFGAFSLASAIGVPTGLYLATHINWHAPFVAVAAMGALLIPLTAAVLPAMRGHLAPGARQRLSPKDILLGVVSDRNQRAALALSAGLMLGHFIIIPFLNPYMEFNLGFSKDNTMLVYIVGGVLTFFSSPMLGRLGDRIGKFRLFAIMVLLSLAPIVIITNMERMPLVLILCITGFWFICSTGRGLNASALISEAVPPDRRGGFQSFNSAIQQLATGSASLLAGALVSTNESHRILHYEYTGYVSVVIVAGTLFLGYRLNKALVRKGAITPSEASSPLEASLPRQTSQR